MRGGGAAADDGVRRGRRRSSPELTRSQALVHGFERGFDLREVGNEANLYRGSGRLGWP
jgi:hypothetical protein